MRIYECPKDGINRFVNFTFPNADVAQELYDSNNFEILYGDNFHTIGNQSIDHSHFRI